MKKIYILLLFPLFASSQVGIGTTTPDATAILDVTSTSKGMLIPRVSLTNVANVTTPINTPVKGLMVWNTNNVFTGGLSGEGFYFFNGTAWTAVNVNSSNTLDQAYDFGGAGLGRTIIADAKPVHIAGTDGFITSGTFGAGAVLDPTIATSYNSRMFFYPRKAAFRAGYDSQIDPDPLVDNEGAWNDDSDIGNYSAAFGRYNKATGEASFAANNDNTASGQYATAFGSDNRAVGKASITFGNDNIANGESSFVGGSSSVTNGNASFAQGAGLIADSFSETVLGSFNKTVYNDLHVANPTAFNAADRAFSVGIGGGVGARKNAFEVFKNGTVRINDRYNLPLNDGTAGQVMVTDGAGNVNWITPQNNKNITSASLYAKDAPYATFTYGALTPLANLEASIFPGTFSPINGNVQVKLFVLCNDGNVPTAFSLKAFDGTTTLTATLVAPTTTTIGGKAVYYTDWSNWDLDQTTFYRLQIDGQGTNISLSNVYVLFKAQ